MRKIAIALLLAALAAPVLAAAPADMDARIGALLSQMTVEEKLGQLQQLDGEANGEARAEHFDLARKGLLGSTLNVRGAKRTNELQRAALQSRLAIPILFAFDVIHGYRTIFPVPLGEAASFDPAQAETDAALAARETRASGVRWTFAPMVDIARDPRWGRIVEGSGEDAYLGSAMARARVRGFQGADYSAGDRVAACAKHWAAYGAAEAGRDYSTAEVPERTLYETYFPPFRAAVEQGVATFMSAFDSLNGVPCTANTWLMRGVLKGDWGFPGLVVSDYTSVHELMAHGVAADGADAARLALNAGVDMEMVSRDYVTNGAALLAQGKISQAELDEAVRRVLRVKFLAGLFDKPYAEEAAEDAIVSMNGDSRQAAYDAAVKSFVLLKNENNALPIPPGVKNLLLVGALADDQAALMGSWTGDGKAEDCITVLQEFRAKSAERGIRLTYLYAAGPEASEKDDILAAVKAAKRADYVVAVLGEGPNMSGEAASRSDLSLPGRQLELLKALAATGKPVALALMSGRPVDLNWPAANIPAIMQAWFPGTMGGPALADALFGTVQPAGKLPLSWPRSVGQIPLYYNHLSTGRPADPGNKYSSKYLDAPNTPLYPFGHGLTYMPFELNDLRVSASSIAPSGTVSVSASLSNKGSVRADEVVQLYLQDTVASVARPVRELKGFERVTLEPGQSRRVEFKLGPSELGFYGADLKYRVEPGEFRVWVSTSSEGGLQGSFNVAH
ncbi:MAG: glycosyl hydrolase [Elusimicrobia bacterium]|nr:glycosyl hydrolase [Elusimicrobiota bacterium]